MTWWTESRATWLELEQLKTYGPAPEGKCRKCQEPAGAEALCGSCEGLRLELMQKFGGRAGSNNPRRQFRDQVKSKQRHRRDKPAPKEWLPYSDNA